MNINPQASSSIEYSSPDQLGRVEKLGLEKNPNNNNWQFRKMRPTCFATNKNAPGRPLDARTLEEAVESLENEDVRPVPEETLNGRD